MLAGMRTGRADLPLHTGRAPAWLFDRMRTLAREIARAVVEEEGPHGLLRRAADPFWFQAFGCVLGFDWHSSGLTTTACGALKEGLRPLFGELGIVVAGGKGKTSRRTPAEIASACDSLGLDAAPLVRASRLSAKVDSSAVQDGYEVYHHTFLFSSDGAWTVVQQGMNQGNGMARRYHWHTAPTFESDPHAGVAGRVETDVTNLVASDGVHNRDVAVELAREEPSKVAKEILRMRSLEMPRHHFVRFADLHPDRVERVLLKAYEAQPEDYTSLLEVRGVGAKGLRALALVAEVTYGAPASVKDPVSFSFAHGGKDGTPFPVDRRTYDATIESVRRAVAEARLGRSDRVNALRRLGRLESASVRPRQSTS
jgi:hypothetical protein